MLKKSRKTTFRPRLAKQVVLLVLWDSTSYTRRQAGQKIHFRLLSAVTRQKKSFSVFFTMASLAVKRLMMVLFAALFLIQFKQCLDKFNSAKVKWCSFAYFFCWEKRSFPCTSFLEESIILAKEFVTISQEYCKKPIPTRMGFEPTRAEHIGLAVQCLNHSATSSDESRRVLFGVWRHLSYSNKQMSMSFNPICESFF